MSKKIKAVYLLASVFDDEVNMIENEAVNMLSNLSFCLLSLNGGDQFVLRILVGIFLKNEKFFCEQFCCKFAHCWVLNYLKAFARKEKI